MVAVYILVLLALYLGLKALGKIVEKKTLKRLHKQGKK